jgi:hypothetical protein
MNTYEMEGVILSITQYSFTTDDGEIIKGSKVLIGTNPSPEEKIKGYQAVWYNAAYEFFTDIPEAKLLKNCIIIGQLISGTKGQLRFKPVGIKPAGNA